MLTRFRSHCVQEFNCLRSKLGRTAYIYPVVQLLLGLAFSAIMHVVLFLVIGRAQTPAAALQLVISQMLCFECSGQYVSFRAESQKADLPRPAALPAAVVPEPSWTLELVSPVRAIAGSCTQFVLEARNAGGDPLPVVSL